LVITTASAPEDIFPPEAASAADAADPTADPAELKPSAIPSPSWSLSVAAKFAFIQYRWYVDLSCFVQDRCTVFLFRTGANLHARLEKGVLYS
jgi:hypothetical protein